MQSLRNKKAVKELNMITEEKYNGQLTREVLQKKKKNRQLKK